MDSKITVVARIRAKEGMEEDLKLELLAIIEPTRLEPGCINYDLHQVADDKLTFLFYENWKSREDLNAHLKSPHMREMGKKAGHMMAGPPEASFCTMLSEPAK